MVVFIEGEGRFYNLLKGKISMSNWLFAAASLFALIFACADSSEILSLNLEFLPVWSSTVEDLAREVMLLQLLMEKVHITGIGSPIDQIVQLHLFKAWTKITELNDPNDPRRKIVDKWFASGWIIQSPKFNWHSILVDEVNAFFSVDERIILRFLLFPLFSDSKQLLTYQVAVSLNALHLVKDLCRESSLVLSLNLMHKFVRFGDHLHRAMQDTFDALVELKSNTSSFSSCPKPSRPILKNGAKIGSPKGTIRKVMKSGNIHKPLKIAAKKQEEDKAKLVARVHDFVLKIAPVSGLMKLWNLDSSEILADIVSDHLRKRNSQDIYRKLDFYAFIENECDKNSWNILNLSQSHVISIVRAKQQNSVMSPDKMNAYMRWFNRVMGLSFPEIHQAVRDHCKQSQSKKGRKIGKAPCPSPYDILFWEELTMIPDTPILVKRFCAKLLLCVNSGLRIQDAQRSVITEIESSLIRGVMSHRKDAKDGSESNPVEWVASKFSLLSSPWWNYLVVGEADCIFMTYVNSKLKKCSILNKYAQQSKTPASTKEIIGCIKDIFRLPNRFNRLIEESKEFDSTILRGHSLRHFMPSLGDLLCLDEDRSSLLGRWALAKRNKWVMARHYSVVRLYVASQTQEFLLESLAKVIVTCWPIAPNGPKFCWSLVKTRSNVSVLPPVQVHVHNALDLVPGEILESPDLSSIFPVNEVELVAKHRKEASADSDSASSDSESDGDYSGSDYAPSEDLSD